jgi:hypothetical protein
MEREKTFVLQSGPIAVVLRPLSDRRWEVTGGTGPFLPGDQVCATNLSPFQKAKERMGRRRTRVSPRSLVLLKGQSDSTSDAELESVLTRVPWKLDPNPPRAA